MPNEFDHTEAVFKANTAINFLNLVKGKDLEDDRATLMIVGTFCLSAAGFTEEEVLFYGRISTQPSQTGHTGMKLLDVEKCPTIWT